MLKRAISAALLFTALLCTAVCGAEGVDALTYAVFPYLPDVEHYQALIESRWAELEPDVRLVRTEWNCYHDGRPEGIDVVMYDAIMLDQLVGEGWIQPISPDAVRDPEDIFPFALEGFTAGGALYGIPALLCGNFLIYDAGCEALAAAEHITDLADAADLLVMNSEDPTNRRQYEIEAIADALGEANPSQDGGAEEVLELIDRLAVDAHKHDEDDQVALAYDSGIGEGYIGFSESMVLLRERAERTRIKAISFSDRENTPRVYADAAAVSAGVEGERYEKCLELMNVMADADVLTALSVREGAPQYLLLARRTPYRALAGRFPIYAQLERLAGDEDNRVIRTP